MKGCEGVDLGRKRLFLLDLDGTVYLEETLLPGAAVGVLLGAFQCVNTYANGVLPGTLLYPAYNCTVSAMTALVGRFCFRERLTVRQWIGVGIGVAAVGVLCV